MRYRLLLIALVAQVGVATAVPAANCPAQPGDCDGDGEASIVEVQGCVNLFLSGDSPTVCENCDLDGNGEVGITDLQGVANCFLDPVTASCLRTPCGPGRV